MNRRIQAVCHLRIASIARGEWKAHRFPTQSETIHVQQSRTSNCQAPRFATFRLHQRTQHRNEKNQHTSVVGKVESVFGRRTIELIALADVTRRKPDAESTGGRVEAAIGTCTQMTCC